ncbi:hypothetical protein [Synechococcus sp. MIT S1220]|uniref:hypothetical protein n=1 Tax=Synechococcus sp. MIT S1220 TaxID=3082549 RepID=UPI0039AFBDE8
MVLKIPEGLYGGQQQQSLVAGPSSHRPVCVAGQRKRQTRAQKRLASMPPIL